LLFFHRNGIIFPLSSATVFLAREIEIISCGGEQYVESMQRMR